MANNINDLYTQQAIKDANEVLSVLYKTHDEIVKISKINIDFMGGSAPKNPAQLQKIVKDYEKIETASTKTTEKLIQNKERERVAEIKLQQAREKSVDNFVKNEQKQQAELEKSINVYSKIQAKVNGMVPVYNNLQAKQAIGLTLSSKEQAQLVLLTNRLNKYQEVLKGTDATIGRHQREVGNYAKANSNLSNSFGQISRELPNFGQSFSVGILSLTNNIGALQDGIKQVQIQNKVLQSEGKPTVSLLSQIGSAVFSFNTALYLAIGLLSAYSKEISQWSKSLFGGNETLELLTENQIKFNESKFKGKKDAQEDILNLRKYLEVAKSDKISMEERQIALKKLREEFPFYFKKLSDANILTGKYGDNVEKLNIALEKEKELQAKSNIAVTNKQKLLDLEKELKTILKLEDVKLKALKIEQNKPEIKDRATAQANRIKELKAEEQYNSIVTKRIAIEKNISSYKEKDIENDSNIFKLKKDIIGLEYSEDKQRKEKIKSIKNLTFENADYLASQYALIRAQKELEAKGAEEIYKDERQTFEQRIQSYKTFVDKNLEIADLDFTEQKRLNEKSFKDDSAKAKQEYDDFVKNKDATNSQKALALDKYHRYIQTITLENGYKLSEIELNYSHNVLDIQKDLFVKQQELRDKKPKQSIETNAHEQELNDLREYNNKLLNVSKKMSLEGIKAIEEAKTDAVRKNNIDRLNLEIQFANAKMSLEIDGSEAWIKANDERIAKTKERTTLEIEQAKILADKTKKYLEDTKTYMQSFQLSASAFGLDSLDFFTKLDKEGKTAFENLVLNGDNATKALGSAFLALGEVFQDIINKMDAGAETRYENDLKRLENQKNISIGYAGDSETAKAEIERQYEVKKKKLDKERAEQKKKLAIYNAIIDTAQAVLAGFIDSGYVGAIFAAALGAAQIAIISSAPMPEFYKGTDNAPEGLALTQERGAEIITDKKGNVKSYGSNKGAQVTMLEKGDKVFTAEKSKQLMFSTMLNGVLNENNILPAIKESSSSLSKTDFEQGIDKLSRTITDRESLTIIDDVNGRNIYTEKNGNRQKLINNRLKIKSFHV